MGEWELAKWRDLVCGEWEEDGRLVTCFPSGLGVYTVCGHLWGRSRCGGRLKTTVSPGVALGGARAC